MALRLIGTVFVVLAGVASVLSYRHAGRPYAVGKSVALSSTRSFRVVYRYLQLSTLTITLLALWAEHPLLLRVLSEAWFVPGGVVLGLFGLALFLSAMRTLAREYSPCFDALLPTRLVREGPYRFLRHPIYTGNLILMAAAFFISGSLWVAANLVVLGVYYFVAAKREETELGNLLPGYREWAAQRGGFLPRVR